MATITALSLLAGSAALVGGVYTANSMNNAPAEPTQEPVSAPVPASVQQETEPVPAPVPASVAAPVQQEPVSEPPPVETTATAPTIPIETDEPVANMAGGAVGRPSWGVLSSRVLAPSETINAVGETVKNALGVKENPQQLQQSLYSIERQLETANFTIYQLDEEIKRKYALYTVERAKFAEEYAKSKNEETIANLYSKKLNSQGQQKGKNDPEVKAKQAEIDKENDKDKKKQLEKEKQDMMSAKPVDDKTLKDWSELYSKALAAKITADDDKTDAERDKLRYQNEILELRKKKEEQEKLVKELIERRKIFLARIQSILVTDKSKKQALPADLKARNDRYARAVKARTDAEDRLKAFYSEIWLPLSSDPKGQEVYRSQFNSLQLAWRSAVKESELARAGLTATPEITTTSAEGDFKSFVADIDDITRNAVDKSGKIVQPYIWTAGQPQGYPQPVKVLRDYGSKQKLALAASVYYEISQMDTETLVRNIPRFLQYFNKLIGTVGIPAEREKVPGTLNTQFNFTKNLLNKFINQVLESSVNSVQQYLAPENIVTSEQRVYVDVRDRTNDFVDKQLQYIKKMFKAIQKARKETNLTKLTGKNLLEFETKARQLYGIIDGVPPKGMCDRIFKPSTYEYLRSGKYKDQDILTKVLEDPTLKDQFLEEIGFLKVSDFLEAQNYAKQRGNITDSALELLRKSAFEEYTKKAERLAFENPTGETFMRNPNNSDISNGDWVFINGLPLTSNQFDSPIPRAGISTTNTQRAQILRTVANISEVKFTPGVFLEANRLDDTNSRGKTVEPISEFIKACELDGNVGHGKEESERIVAILEKLKEVEIEIKENI